MLHSRHHFALRREKCLMTGTAKRPLVPAIRPSSLSAVRSPQSHQALYKPISCGFETAHLQIPVVNRCAGLQKSVGTDDRRKGDGKVAYGFVPRSMGLIT